jgi:structural maintenance of chromosome 1
MGRLECLELENFKSYEGKQTVGPFSSFTCVIGPNGAGKSNLMDAVSFVLGLGARQLRGTVLKDLIHRRDAHSPPARKASVTLIYREDSGTYLRFSRNISGTGVSGYKLNNKEVTYEAYEEVLQRIGVLVKARNFLVFQGDVESVASKSPTELTKLLEQISGSSIHAIEYEEVARKKEEAEERAIFSLQKKKMYMTQRKETKDQKDEAELFQARQRSLSDLKTQQLLWRIFKIKSNMEVNESIIEEAKLEVVEANDHDETLKQELEGIKKSLARANKAFVSAERELLLAQKEQGNVAPLLNEWKAKSKNATRKITELTRSRDLIEADIQTQKLSVQAIKKEVRYIEVPTFINVVDSLCS